MVSPLAMSLLGWALWDLGFQEEAEQQQEEVSTLPWCPGNPHAGQEASKSSLRTPNDFRSSPAAPSTLMPLREAKDSWPGLRAMMSPSTNRLTGRFTRCPSL